jgi:glycerophosphoryl diester phosphodiesterase
MSPRLPVLPLVLTIAASALTACATPSAQPTETQSSRYLFSGPTRAPGPFVIGHRGACGYLPEETLASDELAIKMGADFIEPDLVATHDGFLIARHDVELSATTDVAKKFPGRKTRRSIEGKTLEGWFSDDFTLAEIKKLRATERFPFRDHSNDGLYEVATFREVLELAKKKSRETGRVIGVYPETKNPSYFQSRGLPLEERLVAELERAGLSGREAPIIIQSMETTNLRKFRTLTTTRLLQLSDANEERPYDLVLKNDPRTYGDLMKPEGLREIATYADGIGPWKRQIVPMRAKTDDADGPAGPLLAPTTLVQDAHAAGLFVHPYTFRRETRYLAKEYQGDPAAEDIQFFDLGVDGFFTDNADVAFRAREVWRLKHPAMNSPR